MEQEENSQSTDIDDRIQEIIIELINASNMVVITPLPSGWEEIIKGEG